MEKIAISPGMCLKDKTNETLFRVLHVTKTEIVIINMNTRHKLDILVINNEYIYKRFRDKTLEISNEEEPSTIVDIDLMPEHVVTNYRRNQAIVEIIKKNYAPYYTELLGKAHKPIIETLIKNSGLTRAALWRLIIKYLQSGCKESSLLKQHAIPTPKDQNTVNKRGRVSEIFGRNGKNLTDDDRINMAHYMKKYLSNKLISMKKSYDDMIIERYTESRFDGTSWEFAELPADQCPSFRQFTYYIQQHSELKERRAAKAGKREYRNKKRILTGTSLSNVLAPGDVYEMDACELDIAVVSTLDRSKAVGSPVVYFMVDVYSRLITAASLSFDNNSILAMTNCLASLVEDKEKLLQELGLYLEPNKANLVLKDVMPSCVKPRTVRLDHGSDFISKQKQHIAKELNIEIQYVPPGTGSLKGVVERSFRSFQSHFLDIAEHAGAKDASGVSNHNKEAKLTIEDVKKLMYSFILAYNISQHEGYDLTPDMVANKVGRVPAEIWRYGISHVGNPVYITDRTQFLYSLMVPAKAKITRAGIVYKKLRYIPGYNDVRMHDAMAAAWNGSTPLNVRIDLRSVRSIYYINQDNRLCCATLVDDTNHRVLADMTWPDFDAFRKKEQKLMLEKDAETAATRRTLRRFDRDIVLNAKAASGNDKTDDKNMRDTRSQEKSRVANKLAFENRFSELMPVPAIPEKVIKNEKIEKEVEPLPVEEEPLTDASNMSQEEYQCKMVMEYAMQISEEDEEGE